MVLRALFAGLILGVVLPSPIGSSAEEGGSAASRSVQSAIVAAVEKDRRRFGGRTPVPATLIGIWDGRGGSFVRAFGYADLEKKVLLTPADHFRIGSNTKTFVISVLLQLVAEKKLGLDDPLSRFSLGVNIPNAKSITVRELCDMRSGLFEAYATPQFGRLDMKVPKNFDHACWLHGRCGGSLTSHPAKATGTVIPTTCFSDSSSRT
jgi:CubicO group peptidase (beta-lactamase class C family)